jgi:hypothetical protein
MLNSVNDLGSALYHQGKHEAAEGCVNELWRERAQTPDTINDLDNVNILIYNGKS